MKKTLTLFLLIAALIAAACPGAIAQAPTPMLGDYGSVASGTWTTVGTWKLYSSTGQFDSTATVSPNDRAKSVFVRAGHTIDYLTSAQNMKNLVIEAGAVLRTSTILPTGSPLYVRISGTTVWVDGNFGKDSTDALSIDCRLDGMITLAGSGVANVARLRPYSGLTGNMGFTFAMNAKINYNGSSGTGGAGLYIMNSTTLTSATVTINPGVTVTFAPYSYLGLTGSGSSTPGGVNATFNIDGTLNLPSATSTLYLADSSNYTVAMNVGATGTVNLGGKLVPWLPACNPAVITIAAGGAMNILNGGTADFKAPASTVTGAGTFALQAGATINIGAPAGLDPTKGPLQTATVTLDSAAIYAYTGTGVQQWGPQRPKTFRGLVIGTNSVDTVLATDTMSVYGTLQVDGLLVDNGGFRPAGSTGIVNGTYQFNSGVDTLSQIPAATWNTGSTLLVTKCRQGIATGIPGINQNFFNVTYDDPTTAGVPRFGFVNDTLKGTLYIKNTATNPADGTGNFVVLGKSGVSGNVVLRGNLVVDSAASVSPGYGSGVCTVVIDVGGDVMLRGWMYMNGSGVSNKYLLRKQLFVTNPINGAIRGHSAVAYRDSIVFCGIGIQNMWKPQSVTSMNHTSWRVAPGSTLSLDDTTVIPVSGNGGFTVDSAGTMIMGSPNGINGNVTGVIVKSNANASYVLKSKSAQVTGMAFAAAVKNLTIDDSLGVTLSDTVKVTGTLSLTKGTLATTDSSALTVDSTGSVTRTNGYVVGRMTKLFAAPGVKDFEVGTANGYSPVNFKINTGKGAVTVGVKGIEHPQTFDSAKTGARYWTLLADSTVKNADLAFTYLAADAAGHGNEAIYGVWRYTGTGKTWTALPSVHPKGSKTVSVAGVTSFSDWTLGESSLVTAIGQQQEAGIPTVFNVNQNYPNPFNPATRISYGLPTAGYVTVKVYSMLGQEIATLQEGEQKAGVHVLEFDGSRLASGVYFYRVAAGESVAVKRMLLVK